MVIDIRHEAASQRRHLRVNFPIRVALDGNIYKTLDWSISGVRIGGVEKVHKKGDLVKIRVMIPFQGYDFSFLTSLEILNYNPATQELAGEFTTIGEREQEVLKTFLNGLVMGEMADVDGVLRRIDVPVTPVSLKPDPKEVRSARELERKRELGIRFYIVAGVILSALLLIVLYTNVFQLKVETSVVMSPTDTIISPANGDITFLGEKSPAKIKEGEPLLKVVDPKLEREIQLALMRLQEAEIESNMAESLVLREQERLASAKGIVSSEARASNARVSSLESSLRLKMAEVERLEGLFRQGYVSQSRVDQVNGEYLKIEGELNAARKEAGGLSETLSSVAKGFQVNSYQVQGGIKGLVDAKDAALQRQVMIKGELDFLRDQMDRLILKASGDGKIVKIFSPVGSSVKYGDIALMFERDSNRQVQAFLTQEEAMKIKLGDRADVNFPEMWSSIPHKIIDVDYYTLAVDKNVGRFTWLDPKSRSIIVTLEPVDAKARQRLNKIASGTPATAVFSVVF